MDITGIDYVAAGTFVGSVCGNIIAIIKAVRSHNEASAAKAETESIQKSREETAKLRDRQIQELTTKCSVLENRVSANDKRLDEGASNFKQLDAKIDDLRGIFDNKMDKLSSLLIQFITEERAGKK